MGLTDFVVEEARLSDDAPARGLLTAAGLPLEGLSDQFPSAYVVARHRGVIVGVAGLEAYGNVGLLRSVAVADTMRSRGLGRRLVENRVARAREGGLERVFLLTSTAPAYFERWGFLRADRAEAPAELSRAPEFAYACPASAACLVLRL